MSDNIARKICPSCKRGVLSGVTCNYCGDLAHCSCADRAGAIVNGALRTEKYACYTAPAILNSTAQSTSPNIASDDENAGEDFFDVAVGGAVLPDLPDLPPPYDSIHETSSVSNTPPPAGNDVMLWSLPQLSVQAPYKRVKRLPLFVEHSTV